MHKSVKSGAKKHPIATWFVCWQYCLLSRKVVVLVVRATTGENYESKKPYSKNSTVQLYFKYLKIFASIKQ